LIDESYPRPAAEDTEWTTRMRLAGHTLHFEPKAIVYHHHRRSSIGQILEHAFHFGRHSVKVDPRYAKALGSPAVLRHPVPLLLLSPILATGATIRVFAAVRRYWHTMPAVYLTKLSWCLGAASRPRAAGKRGR
jgi:GT2 family glycosyltransferase